MAAQVCRAGNSDGQYQLGVMNQRCSNEHGAFEWYRKAAEQGHPDAMESLGMMYESGIGVLRDYVEALKWYRKAADHIRVPKLEYIQKGLTRESQRMLGLMYENGIGVPRDYAMALKWYLKAAEQGTAMPSSRLAVCMRTEQVSHVITPRR